jgi:pimeloyl-ACP methyl ester carboxylesterase
VLVCHPGGPGGSSLLFGKLADLARDRTLVLMNPRGTAGSDPPTEPDDYSLEAYASDIDELRDHLGLEQIDLLGHSHGGFVAIVYASAYPERPRRLVLACTTARFSPEVRASRAAGLEQRRHEPGFADAVGAWDERLRGDPDDADELSRLVLRSLGVHFARPESWKTALRIFEEGRERFHAQALNSFNARIAPTFDLRERLPRISAPTLVLAGERDPLGTFAADEIAALVPGADLIVFEGIGHFPWFEDPAAFRTAVLSFLDRD